MLVIGGIASERALIPRAEELNDAGQLTCCCGDFVGSRVAAGA
jgi:hypothetical protein